MNRFIILFLYIVVSLQTLFSLKEINDYYDFGLNEKLGTYNLTTYMRNNYIQTGGTFTVKDSFTEWFLKYHSYIDMPELYGVYFNFDITMANSKELIDLYQKMNDRFLGEFKKLINFSFNYGEAYIGYKNTYVNIKFGFQNLKSTDSIYHNLLLDDYSGVYLSLRNDIMFSRFFDVQLLYNIIRPQNSLWTTKDLSSMTEAYDGLYGKSLFIKKLNFRPLPWIRLGLTDSVYFLGENFNIWFMNPFSLYYMTASLSQVFKNKFGTELNTGASDIKFTFDFSVGFNGWKAYGEILIDDMDAKYVLFAHPRFPDRIAFLVGGELRGYLFTKYLNIPKKSAFFLSNLYINMEYAIASKYAYTREPNQYYEYVREEYQDKFDPKDPITTKTANRVNRVGNFIGFMYGNNADSFDIAIGWRSDLINTPEYRAGYQADLYFDSLKPKKYPDRLFKLQLHYRFFRLGDERNVVVPFYSNEHYWFDEDSKLDTNGDGIPDNDSLSGVGGSDSALGGSNESGSTRRTEFLRVVKMFGNVLDLSFYSDIVRISRFVLGFESNMNFYWNIYNPLSSGERVEFNYKFEFAFVLSW